MSKKIIRRNSLFKLCRLISTGAQVPPAPEHQLERKNRVLNSPTNRRDVLTTDYTD